MKIHSSFTVTQLTQSHQRQTNKTCIPHNNQALSAHTSSQTSFLFHHWFASTWVLWNSVSYL